MDALRALIDDKFGEGGDNRGSARSVAEKMPAVLFRQVAQPQQHRQIGGVEVRSQAGAPARSRRSADSL